MKKILFLILLFTYNAESKEIPRFNLSPDSLANYCPLALGNSYQYMRITVDEPSHNLSNQFIINRDTTIDQKKYLWADNMWQRIDSTGKLFLYSKYSQKEILLMDFSLEAGESLNGNTITSGTSELFGKTIPWKGYKTARGDYKVRWGYGFGKFYECVVLMNLGWAKYDYYLIQFIKNGNDSVVNYSHNYYPEITYTPMDTIMKTTLSMSIKVDHHYSYLKEPFAPFQFIESITIESFYKRVDSIIVNSPVKISSNSDSENFMTVYTLDTLILKKGFEFYYRIQAKDKGIIPHYSYKPDTGYYKVIYGNINVVQVDKPNTQPNEFSLFQNYPNPFNPATVITYQLAENSKVSLKVYDILGTEVITLVNEEQNAGFYKINFNAYQTTNSAFGGKQLSSGVYFYRLQAGDFVQTKKLILLK